MRGTNRISERIVAEPARPTLAEIATAMGVHRSRVHQLERRALKKMRDALLADPVARAALRELEWI